MNLGNRLRLAREAKGLTQEELGKLLNLSDAAINRYEQGNRRPDPATLAKLADALGASTDYLLGRTDIKKYDVEDNPDLLIIRETKKQGGNLARQLRDMANKLDESL